MKKFFDSMSNLSFGLAVLTFGLMLFAGQNQSAFGVPLAQCNPSADDKKGGAAPCYNKAGTQCTYGDKQSTCGPSLNQTQCTCTPI